MTTTRRTFSSGSDFEDQFAYSRVVVDGHWIFVSGTTGYDYAAMSISTDVATQARQCFENIKTALTAANATLADVVRVRYMVTDRRDISALGPVFQQYLGDVRPAATMIVTQLLDPEMKVEVEVTARRS